MKKYYPGAILAILLCALFIPGQRILAQCNVNDKYDKIVSGYHSSIALKDNGTFCTWGSAMKSTGVSGATGDAYSPQDINATNYTGLTGTILKTALGGKHAGAAVDQAILLTTDGLWAWGIINNVLSSTSTPVVKSGAAFGRTYSTAASGFNTYGLPTSVTPTDVESMFATYQTLVIVTKIVSGVGGDVWVLTQTTLAVEGNNGVATTAGTSKWVHVLKSTTAGDYLTNVVALRGQVSNATYNAFIAETSAGLVYTWGNSTYLGNGTASSARTVATQMTMPLEAGNPIQPKMIGVTGGIGTTATTKNTYFVLSNAGNLYSLGDNTQKQCGDFTVVEKTSWVQVKKSAAAGDYLTNVKFFTCQEHNSSYPGVAAVTLNGALYTWGNNSSGMLARSDDGNANLGTSTFTSTATCDPGLTAGISGNVISAEMGGHTLVYLKEGTNQFCYAGHYTGGSMGDGGSGNNGASSATTLLLNCATTPSIAICGYVPVVASIINSTITAAQTLILADGSSTSTITIQLKDGSGTNLLSSGGTVLVFTSAGTIGTVTDNNNGTYTVVLTSANAAATATLSFSVNGTMSGNTASVVFASTLPLKWGTVLAYRQNNLIKVEWTTLQEINVHHFEIERSFDGRDWQTKINPIEATNLLTTHKYMQTDRDYSPQRLFYRIKQVDIDGKYTYSPVAMVSADIGNDKIILYPVPVMNNFYLGNLNPYSIKEVAILSNNGTLVKTWKSPQTTYEVNNLPTGVYTVRITNQNDLTQMIRLIKL